LDVARLVAHRGLEEKRQKKDLLLIFKQEITRFRDRAALDDTFALDVLFYLCRQLR